MGDTPRIYRFGPFEFEPLQQELRSPGLRVNLTPSLTRLLLLFVTRPGELITRDDIASALWNDHHVVDTTNRINTSIRRLRDQLAEGSGSQVWIETVVGTGYRLASPVEAVAPAGSASQADLPQSSTPEPGGLKVPSQEGARSFSKFGWRRVILGLFVLVGVGLGVGALLHRPSRSPAAVSANVLTDPFITRMFPITSNEIDEKITAQAISPSGTFLAYSDPSGVSLETIDGHSARLLASPADLHVDHIAWFPDERRIVLSGTHRPADQSEAWVVYLTGEAPRLLLSDAAYATPSPDGRRIAYTRAQQAELWVGDADGQSPRMLSAAAAGSRISCLLWSPASDRIVVDRDSTTPGSSSAASVNPARGPLDQLQIQHRWSYESRSAATGAVLAQGDDLRFESAILLSDGRLIYLLDAPREPPGLAMTRTDPATGAVVSTPQLLMPAAQGWGISATAVSNLTASADGDRIAAIIERSSSGVEVADLRFHTSSSPPILEHTFRLTTHAATSYPTGWSPDSGEVLFDNGDAGRSVIASQRLDHGGAEVMADTEKDALGQFSPDGKWILFLHFAGEPERVQAIERVPARGGKAVQLVVPGEIEEFRCSAGAMGICVVREPVGKRQLIYYALDPVQGRGKELARTPWEPNVLGDWSVSPDGTTVAMADHDPAHPGIQLVPLSPRPAQTASDVFSKVTEIPITGFGIVLEPSWSADGKGFFVETNTPTGYDLVYANRAGQASLLRQSPELIWAVPSRDGKKLAFPISFATRNIWVGLTRADAQH
jgi:DNA-binding winged helix-turn-helix (wHTH) protein/Tol biopolymer transport system component